MAKHYNLNATLQTRDKSGKPVIFTPADNPQPLPDALAREAVARGLATEVAAAPSPRKSAAPASAPEPEDASGADEGADDDPDA
ncbi:hypothetical protein OF001_U20069 [Pseudomonas sp. OF001]|uniref:hypothetical protein n=1 Tax=Pseudomonas sp. OF001 TaxID=2772300 RepID=UPI00191A90EC|nr:hypothetical protein [Pseudomonas sp. OF001]CAD5377142.1 hypothetical protein OF001_U20069 [Pseudomonas sp. OF001]